MLSKSSFFLVFIVLLFCKCSNNNNPPKFYTISGKAQGTSYSIILVGPDLKISKDQIDSILQSFDAVLSTYVRTSLISKFNSAAGTIFFSDSSAYFKNCLLKSQFIFERSKGAFDPTVFPLIDAWGFFKNQKTPLSKVAADSILPFVSFEKDKLFSYKFKNNLLYFTKKDKRVKLDFNAIAQGYAVDVLAEFIREKGYSNFYIELGGEVYVSGLNRENQKWKIGIDTPVSSSKERSISEVLSISNEAVATSGNYRKFYEVKGKKYAHTIDPKTGLQVTHNLLSATVIAKDCATADGFATAFMVMGKEKTIAFLKQNRDLGLTVYLIYNEKGSMKSYASDSSKLFSL
jgi:thiamine biosynthesis lipoprotein